MADDSATRAATTTPAPSQTTAAAVPDAKAEMNGTSSTHNHTGDRVASSGDAAEPASVKTEAAATTSEATVAATSTKLAGGAAPWQPSVEIKPWDGYNKVLEEEIVKQGTTRRVMKLDPTTKLTSAESAVVLSKATEMFTFGFVLAAYKRARECSSETIRYQDVSCVVAHNENLEFLSDLLPETSEVSDTARSVDKGKKKKLRLS